MTDDKDKDKRTFRFNKISFKGQLPPRLRIRSQSNAMA